MVPHEKNGPTMLYSDENGFLKRKKDSGLKEFDEKLRAYHKNITHKIGYMCNTKGPDRQFNDKLTFEDLFCYIKKKINKEIPFVIQKCTKILSLFY